MFQELNTEIALGDTVIAYISPENKWHFTVGDGKENCRVGSFSHSRMIGRKWGEKLISDGAKGFLTLLKPSPELWTRTLRHRTQILYTPDIAFIEIMLDLKIGSRVIESGTGSGSFSHSLIRSIAPKGHLYTFEFHKERYLMAQEEFKEHKLQEYVTVYHKNVCKDGFTDQVTDIDADLPSPWEALPLLKVNFRKSSVVKIATFSPCIEQVFKTLAVLKEEGYKDIKMFEILQKPLNVFPMSEWKSLPESTECTEKPDETLENVETKKRKIQGQEEKSFTSQCAQSIKGHTSYLVFATFLNN